MKRIENESMLSYAGRVTQALIDGDIDYKEWSQDLFNDVPYGDETLRRCKNLFSLFLDKAEQEEIDSLEDKDEALEIYRIKSELERERVKLSQEKIELREQYRWEARSELYRERIAKAIEALEPIRIPAYNPKEYQKVGTTALISMSDFHAGSVFEVKGYNDEVVNKYDFDIMKARMWKLLNDFCNDDVVYDDITVALLGDYVENILRMSSLQKLREPVIDTVIKFSEVMAQWIAELYRRTEVPINVVCVGGNHDVVRSLTSKPTFEDENLAKLVVEFLKLRLVNNPNISIDDYKDVNVKTIRNTNIMFYHGVDKDLAEALDYFSNIFNLQIDEIMGGHFHGTESKGYGYADVGDRLLTRVGSIVGTDPYSKSIRKGSRPSGYVALYTDDGKTWSRNYYL